MSFLDGPVCEFCSSATVRRQRSGGRYSFGFRYIVQLCCEYSMLAVVIAENQLSPPET